MTNDTDQTNVTDQITELRDDWVDRIGDMLGDLVREANPEQSGLMRDMLLISMSSIIYGMHPGDLDAQLKAVDQFAEELKADLNECAEAGENPS